MHLVVDIGNTRVKWALSQRGELSEQVAVEHSQLAASLRAYLAHLQPQISAIVVANVAGPAIAALLTAVTREAVGREPMFLESTRELCGIRNAYPVPHNLGIDRLVAMIGARESSPGPWCVVCVGTAMTIDVLDCTHQHLGGLIVPGPQLMVSSLYANTSDIGRRAAGGERNNEWLATDTLGAVEQGAEQALAALVDRVTTKLQARLGQQPTLVMTGGAAEAIQPLIGHPIVLVRDLVLRGLGIVAQQQG